MLSLASLGVSIWAWRIDRRTAEPGPIALAVFAFAANRGQLALSLLLLDLFLFFVASEFEEPPGALRTWTGLAAVPLAVISFTTRWFGWPAFLIPPWARTERRSVPMRNALLTLVAGLGLVTAFLGLIWLFAVPEADRFWGLAAIVIGAGMLVGVARADRSGNSGD